MSETTETPKDNTNVVDLSSPLTIYNATEAAIQKLKDDYGNLTIAGVNDKDGYKAVSEGLRIVVGLRNKVDKRRLELKRQVDAGAKTIVDDLAPLETHLKAEKDKIDDAIAKAKQEAAEAELKKFNNRTGGLFALGFRFNGMAYVLGGMSLTPEQIKTVSDFAFAQYINDGTQIAKDLKAAEEEKEARAAALEAKEKELAEREAKLNAAEAATAPVEETIQNIETVLNNDLAKPFEAVPSFKAPTIEPAIGLEVSDNGVPSVQQPEKVVLARYELGFGACKIKVLNILASPEKFTRAQLIEKIQNLIP